MFGRGCAGAAIASLVVVAPSGVAGVLDWVSVAMDMALDMLFGSYRGRCVGTCWVDLAERCVILALPGRSLVHNRLFANNIF